MACLYPLTAKNALYVAAGVLTISICTFWAQKKYLSDNKLLTDTKLMILLLIVVHM